jgi:hypothetical protein
MADNPKELSEYMSDHDLLIRLDTRVSDMRDDLKEMKDGTAEWLAKLESDVTTLKLWRAGLAGAWAICTLLLIPLLISYAG